MISESVLAAALSTPSTWLYKLDLPTQASPAFYYLIRIQITWLMP